MWCRQCPRCCRTASASTRSITTRLPRRAAHAAARSLDDQDLDESSSQSASSSRNGPSVQRSKPVQRRPKRGSPPPLLGYRFPKEGRLGGPPDPFEILALDRAASDKDIKQQYYQIAMMLHPDSAHPKASPEHFSALSRAYALLSKTETRERYLRTGDGWSGTHETAREGGGLEAWMRAEAMRRHRARPFRESEGGSGAWSFDTGRDTKDYEGPTFMSNPRFIVGLSLVIIVTAYFRSQHIESSQRHLTEVQDQTHFTAATALQNARNEATLLGHERRERIRRRVQETKTLGELDSLAGIVGPTEEHAVEDQAED